MQQFSTVKNEYCYCELDFTASLELDPTGLFRVEDTSSYSAGCTAIKKPIIFAETHLKYGFIQGIKIAFSTVSCVSSNQPLSL